MTGTRTLRRLAPVLLVAPFLAACNDRGYPSTDTEAIMLGLVLIALLAAAAFAVWCITR